MSRPLGLLLLLVALATGGLLGCSTRRADSPAAAARRQTPPRFARIQRLIHGGLLEARRANAPALRARSEDLVEEGLALIRGTLPHDVARTDVPRYLEGRAQFGEALKRWVGVVETGPDAALFDAIRGLDGACRGWIDAYLGLAPETSV